MMINKNALPRRTFLRGSGACLALPLLDAMVPALTAMAKTAASPVRRFGAVYVPNGMAMEYWTPAAEGTAFELTPVLQPLAAFRENLLVTTGLNGPLGGNHAGGATGFLTGVSGQEGTVSEGVSSISIDQIIAKEFGRHTQLASLEIGLDGYAAGTCDAQFSCALTNTISWRSPTTPLTMEPNPRMVFERLFGDSGSTNSKTRLARLRRDRSILDSVNQSIGDLERAVGERDRVKIGEYLEAVRDVERRIQKAEEQSSIELPAVEQPAGIPPTFEEHAKLMFDLQVLAYQCDLTRVGTFMFGRELTGRTYPEIGVPDAHHPLSHHQYDRIKIEALAKINAYHATLFARYLDKLRATPDGDGSLLDHTLILYGGGMSDSNAHSHNSLPLLLVAGNASGVQAGRHLKYGGAPSPNLLLAILEKLGMPLDRIGTSNGTLGI
jgi:hypothetical protein